MHLLLALVAWIATSAAGQNVLLDADPSPAPNIRPQNVIHWEPIGARRHEQNLVVVSLRLRTEQDFTLYHDKVSFSSPSGAEFLQVTAPATRGQFDPISRKEVEVYYGGEFEVAFRQTTPSTSDVFAIEIRYIGCTQSICLFPYTERLDIKLFDTEDPPPNAFLHLNSKEAATDSLSSSTDSWEHRLATSMTGGTPWWWILLIAIIGGILTNLTPCVYPMVPITIRILGQQTSRPLVGSLTYAGGIFVMYASLGMFAAWTGSMFGGLTASPFVNSMFAVLMAALGLSMLGAGRFSKLQQLGSKLGAHRTGASSTFLMGVAAGMVAAPCTGPILAALLTIAASQGSFSTAAGLMCAYSLGFALPYVLLGQTAAFFTKIRVPVGAQIAIKVGFAGVMFGLSFYYLRIPLYSWLHLLTGMWPTLAIALGSGGLVILGAIYFRPSWQHQTKALVAAAILLGAGAFSGLQSCFEEASKVARTQLAWISDETTLFEQARSRPGPILIDMWAEWCEACKKMEATTFADPHVIDYLNEQGWHLAKFDLTESNEITDAIQSRYRIQSLPTLVIIPDPNQPTTLRHIYGYVDGPGLLDHLFRITGE